MVATAVSARRMSMPYLPAMALTSPRCRNCRTVSRSWSTALTCCCTAASSACWSATWTCAETRGAAIRLDTTTTRTAHVDRIGDPPHRYSSERITAEVLTAARATLHTLRG